MRIGDSGELGKDRLLGLRRRCMLLRWDSCARGGGCDSGSYTSSRRCGRWLIWGEAQ